ncbi:MAG: carbamoyl-phosphate synthase (glutamine-hydrolyzing) large subunit [Ignavibacteriota bacterium]|jgi:carbamoyl-phosphate synthase large subunit|nr:carbamoyl-phosphate synthase (glutamine-hydrolyzing) large subunit [Ignavibacteriota bacterium]MBW7843424.1 carbamoyl-phosphate synthase (glutamine-hydrolyzing) large subunit [Ignavibacterium sp.]MCO6446372.1 carbamoyl-phosphate synthase (glutamine-hydrolyzing) large subunit [Ignavibacterium album]MCZ2268717.1 carbamoyl-phosphate synthase (glutamine-hydrolyzing) large subunit [Ignavibacteriales bacterium]MDX9711558.1 carbamoyl-phosphate synthase (glutamine-hydrolyzing) large subunit [Ignavib
MIKKGKPKKVLILGSGALQIGQAGEFDYSGSQAIKALKEDGIATVLVNPNIATIQTSENFADKVYFVPIKTEFVEKIIIKEQPDSILLQFGGQTALNVGVDLYDRGILEKYNIKVLGTSIDTIKDTEDRLLFAGRVTEIGLKVAKSKTATSVDEAVKAAEEIGFPVMVRIAYALGGLGSGIVNSKEELIEKARRAFSFTKQILIEESLYGWKEIEYEIVRDKYDNCITICSMENIDPMGIHTGDSVVIAPVQTLSAKENFKLRSIGIKLIRHLGIIGECNIQYALNPDSEDYRIIEVNARLSRSSALASKATGYPLAFIATKLALDYALNEVANIITQETSANFEPTLDYVALKFPRWDLQKFQQVSTLLGSEMKSVGEVMSLGRSFEEVLQKAVRMLDVGMNGFVGNNISFNNLDKELAEPTDKRIFAIAQALQQGYSVEKIHQLTKITKWFLYKMKNIVDLQMEIAGNKLTSIDYELMKELKQTGFSDIQIAQSVNSTELEVRKYRKSLNVIPVVKQIDTMAAEFPAQTNYLYLTYHGSEDDIMPGEKDQIVVLGSGAYRIGSSVEFDWCCVNAVNQVNKSGYKSIMINCNPETVSTDYDICDKLYFEQLTFERVLDIYDKENPNGIIVSMGGQVPNNLSVKLHNAGIKIIGTSPEQIDNAESRHKFSKILDEIEVDQPEWKEVTKLDDAKTFAEKVGYPVLIRPSYVLSGAAMSIVLTEDELEFYLKKATELNTEHPVVISKFITDAREIEVDAVANGGELFCYAISEHVENAGVHSGDATLVLPPQRTYLETMRKVKIITKKIAGALKITGPFNIQYIAKDNKVKVIECNLRASRSFPFVSKTLKINFIEIATRLMLGEKVPHIDKSSFDLDYVGVKASQFSFTRLKGSDPVTGVEMSSTGEVACLGDDFNEAFLKSLFAIGQKVPAKGVLLSTGTPKNKAELIDELKVLQAMGLEFYGTKGTSDFYKENGGIDIKVLFRPLDNQEPGILSYMANGKIDLVINIPKTTEKVELDSDYIIRRKAVDLNIPLFTNVQIAKRFVKALKNYTLETLPVKSWDEYE